MLSLGLYAGWVERPGRVRYLGVSCAFVAGLLSKPMLVTLPAVLLLLDFWPLRRSESLRVRVVEKLPWFALSAFSSLVTLKAHQQAGTLPGFESFSFPARAANALLSYTVYLEKLFWPSSLAVYYPYRETLAAGPIVAAGIFLLMVSVAVIALRRRYPCLLVGWFWYLGMLVPVIGLVQVGGQALADRYTYLPAIGIFVALGFALSELVRSRKILRAATGFLAVAGLASLAWCSHLQVGYWKDTTTLFEHAVQVTRPNLLAHVVLGNELSHASRFDAAIVEFKKAAAIDPHSALARNNIGVAYRRSGNLAQAARWFQKAIRADARYAKAYYNLGGVLQRQERFAAAARAYARAIEQDPEFLDAHSNAGIVLLQLGHPQQALHEFREAVRIAPDSANANYNLGNALLILGHTDEAIVLLREALRLDPAHPMAAKRLRRARGERRE